MLIGVIYLTRPVPEVISTYSVHIDGLTLAQKKNICLASNRLNNVYIKPGEIFSFNTKTGPRTLQNGFMPSRAILEDNVIESVGGGICLVASALYNSILLADMEVIERKAHSKVVSSFPPGLDATVWYGINDLKFRNNTTDKVRINTSCDYQTLKVNINGHKKFERPTIVIRKGAISPYQLQVKVMKKKNNLTSIVSEDVYKL